MTEEEKKESAINVLRKELAEYISKHSDLHKDIEERLKRLEEEMW